MSSRQRLATFAIVGSFTMLIIAIAASFIEPTPIPDSPITGPSNESQNTNMCLSIPIFPGCFRWRKVLAQIFGIKFNPQFGQLSKLVVLALLFSIVVGSLILIYWATGDETIDASSSVESTLEDSEPLAKGSTPVSSSNPNPTNELYRAWWEIVRQAGLPYWRSRTPSEVSAAAIDAGVDPEIVTEITPLFRAVRYGNHPLTDEVEQQASTALDRLQSHTTAGERETTDS